MANLPELSNFDAGVYQIETTDLVLGGVGGTSNASSKNLTNRTRWLFDQNTTNVANISALVSHATTVDGEISSLFSSVSSINANLASINGQLPLLAPLANPSFTGSPTAPTQSTADNSSKLATTAFVKNLAYAPLASPAFTGTPIAPTAGIGNTSGQLATCAFVNPGSSLGGTYKFRKNPDGSIDQWGSTAISGTTTVTFPTTFPTACDSFVLTNINSTNQIFQSSKSTSGAVVTNGTAQVDWQAKGH